MKYNLFVNYYTDKNPERQKEIDFCFEQNLNNEKFNCCYVIINGEDSKKYDGIISRTIQRDKILHRRVMQERPTYNDYFDITERYFNQPDNINIICNSDIVICKDTMEVIEQYVNTSNKALALSRWDVSDMSNYQSNAVLFNRADSQDTWIFKGGVPNVEGADFTMGIAGCDNSIAYLLESAGYSLVNPSLSIKTYHIHLSNIRNYINGENIQRVPPPYVLVPPTQ
jgi:hypothetical protein